MLPPVVCFTCGFPIGDVAEIFLHLRAARVRAALEARGTAAAEAAVDSGLQVDCSDVLDALGLRYDCCRMHLVTAMVFTDHY